ncbi:MAG TPA: glycosyltransferase family 2 protein [Chitinispirillaceae bacterium]|nr:glycosyltransferase family 2 protein [Chitinispirillaceae bacterium]
MIQSNDMVSVIIPTYNRAYETIRALKSVIAQTYNNFEVLVIDDCSDDYELLKKMIAQIDDKRIKLIRNDINRNGAFARNVGINLAIGKYIAFLDSDDEWDSQKLHYQVETANKHTGNNFLIYCKSHVIRRGYVEELPHESIREDQSVANYLFVCGGFMPTPSLFLPVSLARKNLFNENLLRHQDYDFLLKLEGKAIFILINRVLVKIYANHPERSEKRGANYNISKKFLVEYDRYFNIQEKNYFWLQNVGFYMARSNNKIDAIISVLKNKHYKYVKLKHLLTYIIYYLFVNTIAYGLLERVFLFFRYRLKNK